MDKHELSLTTEEFSWLDQRMERHLEFMSATAEEREQSIGEVLKVRRRSSLPKTAIVRDLVVEDDGSVRWL
jgi:hypothetical protein